MNHQISGLQVCILLLVMFGAGVVLGVSVVYFLRFKWWLDGFDKADALWRKHLEEHKRIHKL